LQIDALGNTGGEIVNNAATILLDGPNSNFVDAAGLDALSNFSNNTAMGSFTIQDGRNFTSPSDFANAGIVNIGATSTFTTGGAGNYNQSGGSTQVDGALTAGGGQVNINGGALFGNGTITGNVLMAGTIYPGDAPNTAGALHIVGNYTQTGAFNLSLGGLGQGTTFSLLTVTGMANLSGTLNIGLINGFFPMVGDTFTFLTAAGGLNGSTFSTVNGLNIGGGEELMVVYNPFNVGIETIMLAPLDDSWLGGTDVWSNAGKWSLGTVPGANNDVFIYSGVANDLVTLNVGSTTINLLTLGGLPNGFTSELTDGGVAQTLTIFNGLNIGQTGFLDLTGASTVTAATMGNSGQVYIGTGATVNLTNQAGGIQDVPAFSSWQIYGNFALGGLANTGFTNLTTVEGTVDLENKQSWVINPIGGTLTIFDPMSTGALDVGHGTTLMINGAVGNSGFLSTGRYGGGGNVTNSGLFALTGGSMATIDGNLINTMGTATVDLENAGMLLIKGDADNFGTLSTGGFGGTGSNTLAIDGTLTNEAGGTFALNGPMDMATIGNGVTTSWAAETR
jgi:hypothetical protein